MSRSTRWLSRRVRMLREIPRRAWKSSKRVTPMKASRTMSRLHHSPTASRHCAIEQFSSAKLVRCTAAVYSVASSNALRSATELRYGTHCGSVSSTLERTLQGGQAAVLQDLDAGRLAVWG